MSTSNAHEQPGTRDIVYAHIDSPVGPVWAAATDAGVCAVGLGADQPGAFLERLTRYVDAEPPREDPGTLALALTQLREYFSRIRREFDLPLDIVYGTAFQQAVWKEIAGIPYGTTATYGEIARRVGQPQAARAVGAALGANLLPLLIPCHRVIGARNGLIGYSAGGGDKGCAFAAGGSPAVLTPLPLGIIPNRLWEGGKDGKQALRIDHSGCNRIGGKHSGL